MVRKARTEIMLHALRGVLMAHMRCSLVKRPASVDKKSLKVVSEVRSIGLLPALGCPGGAGADSSRYELGFTI
jgi:hypothetical protein